MVSKTSIGLVLLVVALLLLVAWAILTWQKCNASKKLERLPPGPRRWSVVGNMFQLGWSGHESFAILASKQGPIMTLWLGSMCTVVISSNEVAREMFKNHDVVLVGRKIYEAMEGDIGNEGTLITAQYGPRWRMLRRLCTAKFFVMCEDSNFTYF
ncbi:cytochrome P450 76A2-like [Coffea arabica]|uniref:Cytochrome P450 76A2-like n=1 Tax=Coffea arabica TaxID=13443 RepID=A0ABM4VH16_COFAR